MDRAELTKIIAPCGLDCGKCLSFDQGEIRRHSRALAELLGPNFESYAARYTGMNPVFEKYPAFKALLGYLSQGACGGCRKGKCLFGACRVRGCVVEKGVDFCFECDAFPCDKTGMPDGLFLRWKTNNERMKAIGVENYFREIKELPRYP